MNKNTYLCFNVSILQFLSNDNHQFGCYGIARVQITQPKHFFLRILGGGSFTYTDSDLRNFIKADLVNTIRNNFARYSLDHIKTQNKLLGIQIKANFIPILKRWGLDLLEFQIIGFRIQENAN